MEGAAARDAGWPNAGQSDLHEGEAGTIGFPLAVGSFPLTWGTVSQSSTGWARIAQRVSLCTVCWRSHRQNFFISMRSRSFSLFLVVM